MRGHIEARDCCSASNLGDILFNERPSLYVLFSVLLSAGVTAAVYYDSEWFRDFLRIQKLYEYGKLWIGPV